eukprot:scaffold233_cov198-Chaetoceros_neogracile.AAC.7
MSKVLHHATANGVNKVAVMCCGPHGLVSEAKCKAAKYETNDVKTLLTRRLDPFISYSGPSYGDLSTDLSSDRYGIVVLIAEGIGVTPMQSICRQIAHHNSTCKSEVQKVFFVWASRDIAMMDPIGLDLS